MTGCHLSHPNLLFPETEQISCLQTLPHHSCVNFFKATLLLFFWLKPSLEVWKSKGQEDLTGLTSKKHSSIVDQAGPTSRKMFFKLWTHQLGYMTVDSPSVLHVSWQLGRETLGKLTANLTEESSKVFENSPSYTFWLCTSCLPRVNK